MTLIGTVDGVFTISGRGVVLSFEFAECLDPNLKFRKGDKIQLRKADGFIVDTAIRSVEYLKPLVRRKPVDMGLLLPPDTHRNGNMASVRWVRLTLTHGIAWKSGWRSFIIGVCLRSAGPA